jgi:DnaJ-class molecular chaperone
MNPFQILGIGKFSTPDEIKKAYRKLAQRYHPDRNKAPSAEAKFKQVKEAYELLSSGGYEEPKAAPAPTPEWTARPGYNTQGYSQHVTLRCTFKDTFVGNLIPIPGTPFVAKPPYGVSPGFNHRMVCRTLDQRSQDTFDITWDIYDPAAFYTIKNYGNKRRLTCKLIVSAAQVLAKAEVTLPNINPAASSFTIKLQANSPLRVPRAGLQGTDGRDDLYVELDIIYKDLKDERYDILLELQSQCQKAIADYKQGVFT